MASGAWPEGTVLPSLRSLAKKHRVSKTTLEWAVEVLKREARVAVNPRKRLVVRNPDSAPALTHLLIVQIYSTYLKPSSFKGAYISSLQKGIETAVSAHSEALLTSNNFRFASMVPRDLPDLPVRGILLMGHYTKEVLDFYESLSIPVVMVDEPCGRRNLHVAQVDDENAAFDATRRLIALGHRRIAFLRRVQTRTRQIDPDSAERQDGYKRAIAEAGLPVDRGLIFNSFNDDKPDSPAIRAVFRAKPGVTAALAVDPSKARLLVRAAKAGGLSIPEDLSLVCFQERPPANPEFSGPRTDFEELGRRAGELVREPKLPPRRARVRPVWADGKTIGPPKQRIAK
jgi:DNA-binding LacI/PurR family transcriptional regulator